LRRVASARRAPQPLAGLPSADWRFPQATIGQSLAGERESKFEWFDRTSFAENRGSGARHDCGRLDVMVTENTLIEGVWFAMEQAGRLLGSAVFLYGTNDFGSAIALGMFAHEELGRSRILLDMADEVHRGATIDTEELRGRCNNHLEKQRRGAFSVTFRGSQGEPLTDALRATMKSIPGSAEYEVARAAIDEAAAASTKAQPMQRHSDRMGAVYLDLAPDGRTWKRPAAIGKQAAYERLNEAVNDYSMGRQWFDEPLLSTNDDRLLAASPKFALLRLSRPSGLVMPPAVWPSVPMFD
jgi:AbiV family abortive infection protein